MVPFMTTPMKRSGPLARRQGTRAFELFVASSLAMTIAACGSDPSTGSPGVTPPPVTPPVVTPRTPTIPVAYSAMVLELDSNPPSPDGLNSARVAPITEFENRLWAFDPFAQQSDVLAYYEARMARVAAELREPVTTGFRVWTMYNHGFIVKTPTAVFAFDLVEGKTQWIGNAWVNKIPEEILARIDVLMVSHEHVDHWDNTDRIPSSVKAGGRMVLYPGLGLQRVSVTRLAFDKTVVQVKDLRITPHAGQHSVANMVYEVVTGEGYRIVHTGDNQTSVALPALQGVDVLLLNGWVNESGATTHQVGMQRAMDKLKPAVMIPGHLMEISRPRSGWYPYVGALTVQNTPLQRTNVVVTTWGERMDFVRPACAAGLVRIYQACGAP
jgi:L-ascorbate metabolism protein UlaG (beta-lactamase superfamily)